MKLWKFDKMWLVKVLCTLVTCWTLTQGQLVSPSAIDECPRECSCQTMTFDCSNSDLTSLPGGIPSVRDVTTLDISRNKFDDVPASLHKTTPSLKRLDASHNRIRTLRKAAFRRLNLTFLSLSWNQLHHIDQDAFFNLSHLKELDLSGNRLSTLKGETFGKLAALQELVLDRNLFTEVPATALSRLISLHALGLGGNQLTSIKANVFSQLRNLVILDMKNNYIREIDEEGFAGLSALNALELEGNLLTDIPVAIGRLTSVQSIKLSANRLERVRSGVLQRAPSLERVEMRGNPLSVVERRAFANMPRLKELELLGVKKLTAFPDLSGTNQIRELRVYGSQLTRLPENFCHLVPGIKRMYLPSNRLRKMPILLGCTELRFVDLSYNEVQRLESGTFTSQRLLQDLILRNNFITEIPAGAFTGLSQLQIIDLRHNRIAYIDQTAFQPLVSLRRLNLNNNMFPSLPSEGLQSLTHLYSANNVHLSHFPSPHSLPSLQHVQVSYAYHCCQFRPGFLSRNFTGQEQSQFGTVEEGVSERVIFPGTGTIDLSPWRGQWDDVWPEFENLSDSLGRLGRKLLHDFKLGYPTRIDNFTEKYEDVDSLMFDQSPSWTMNGPVTCTPAPSPFMPCEDLFDWWALRCGVWVVFLLALLGNGTVVFVLIFSRSKMDVPRFLVCNLAAADFFMGLYLGFLAVVDASTLGEFRRYAIRWQMSDACQLTGFLGVFSSELSVFTLAVITLERNYAITHAMHLNKRLSLRHAAAVMTGGWAFALLMATLPLLGVSDYRRFAVCLPFQTAGAGTGYLVFLMLANGSAFAVLMACYCKMYCAIRGSQAWNTNDSRIARRMALLVMTDFICWAPIAFFSLAAASGVHLIGLSGAKVFTVFVLPFNSCCNPFLYAILTKQFKKDCVLICKAIEESRVTRGIGRGRHSSNFSNRHTPANTNSLAERTSKASGTQCSCQQRLLAAPGDVEQQQLATANTSKPTRWHVLRALVWCPVLKRSTKSHRANGNRQNGQVITTQFMHNTPAALASGTICQRSGEPRGHRMVSVSSDTFSGSRTDSLRQHNGCRQRADLQLPQSTNHHLHHHHHPHRHRRRRNSWSVTRRPSQESSLSTSRNDSSATAGSNATQSWQLSRSSVSSDVSGALAPVAAAASASSDTAADPSRGILKKPTLTRQTAMCDELVPLSPGCHHQPGCPLHSATCRHGASSDTVRANHSPKQVGRRKSSGGVIGSTVIPAQKVPTIIEATVEKTSPPRYRTPLLLNFPAEAENASTPAELLCLNDLTPSSWDARVEGGETSNTDTRLQLPADCQQRCRSAEHVPFPSQTTNKMVASASDTCVRDVSEKRLHDWLIDVRLANEQQLQMQQPISSEYSSTIETPGCFSSDLVVVEKHPLMEDPR